jgi:orotate phosphoribosyltransferase
VGEAAPGRPHPAGALSGSGYVRHGWKTDVQLWHTETMIDPSLAASVRDIASLQGEFRLRSGQVSSTYFDKYRFEAEPTLLKRVAAELIPLLPSGTEVLAGLELGGVPIATAVSLATGIPAVFVRKKAKEYGTRLAVEGCSVQGKQVVLIEDVITTGGAVADAARLVREAGANVIGVVCAIWRGEGPPRIAALPELPVAAAMTKDDLSS